MQRSRKGSARLSGERVTFLSGKVTKAKRPARRFRQHRVAETSLRFSRQAGRRELAHPCAQTCAPCSRLALRCSASCKGAIPFGTGHSWPASSQVRANEQALMPPAPRRSCNAGIQTRDQFRSSCRIAGLCWLSRPVSEQGLSRKSGQCPRHISATFPSSKYTDPFMKLSFVIKWGM